ncbi:metal ABC transporter substrate-binding protein [Chitinispirillales bacterium ANBcel5]|uniref:metal ABC transporter substrate-binding protein n=1 Tax=Cellulosispirillum alkaliphilum TaxID=3039283 RepID=UPI002A57B20C|nr:metal ABC transporter substrate-binding protein [Chitinispirillales bacterium ANBcel5]
MKIILCILVVLMPLTILRAGKLNVVASVPDLGDMAERIGGDKIKVTTLATGREDFHAVPVRPSFLPILNRADILLTLGLDAEHAWLPALVKEARNPKIMKGREGWVEVYKGITVLGIADIIDRSEGEQHPRGNPHYNIGPQCGTVMAQNIYDALSTAAPQHRELFKANLGSYMEEIDSTIIVLKERSSALSGIAVIDYHPDLPYLAEFYDMEIIGHIEPKAGVSPTAAHLRSLEAEARKRDVKLIIHNQSQSPRIPQRLARNLGLPVVEIANAVGAKREIKTWLQLQEYNNRILLEALGADR